MAVNESIVSFINNILQGTQLGIYVNKILLTLGGLAGVTLIYIIVMFYYTRKTYKEEKLQTKIILEQYKLIDEIYEKIINKNK